MGHGFETEMDKMFAAVDSVRPAPWHIKETGEDGTGATTLVTTDEYERMVADGTLRPELMRLSGHDFEIIERDLRMVVPSEHGVIDPFDESQEVSPVAYAQLPGYKALVRDDNGEPFNVVGAGYQVFQNSQLWDLVEAVLDQPNVRWNTGGTIKGGKVVWVLAVVDEPFTIKGDDSPMLPYIVATASHDGTLGISIRNTNIRVVCWNTLDASTMETGSTGREFTFRHTKKLGDRIETAKLVLAGSKDTSLRFRELAEDLVAVPFGEKAREKFLVEFIPEPAGMVVSDRVKGNIEEARAKVSAIWNSKSIPEDHKFTGYGALQAGIEYLDHLRGFHNTGTYLGRTLIKAEPLKNALVPLIHEVSEWEQENHSPLITV